MGQGQAAERGKGRGGAPVGGAKPAGASRGVRSAGYSDALVTPAQQSHFATSPKTATDGPGTPRSNTSKPSLGEAPAGADERGSSAAQQQQQPPAAAIGGTSRQASKVSVDPSAGVHHSPGSTLANPSSGSGGGGDANPTVTVLNIVPVVVRFLDPNRIKAMLEAKSHVFLASEFSGWKPTIQMTASEDNFYCIAELPVGQNRVRFMVNGEPFLDASQPTSTENGQPANVVVASDVLLLARDDEDAAGGDDDRDWGQEEFTFEETRKYPPMLPPHLRYTPLNTPPTQMRCARDGTMNIAGLDTMVDPEHLPLPLSVTINHVYLQRRDDHAVLGMTTRYGNKFTTIVYYKSIPPPPAPA